MTCHDGWGAAEALCEAIGAPMFPVVRAEYAPIIAAARAQLGEAAFAAVWAKERSLPLGQVVAEAYAEMRPRPPNRPSTWPLVSKHLPCVSCHRTGRHARQAPRPSHACVWCMKCSTTLQAAGAPTRGIERRLQRRFGERIAPSTSRASLFIPRAGTLPEFLSTKSLQGIGFQGASHGRTAPPASLRVVLQRQSVASSGTTLRVRRSAS